MRSTLPVLQVIKGPLSPQQIAPSASVCRAAVDMIKSRANSLVVTEDNKMAGILTERDFLKLGPELGQGRKTLVSELMTPAENISSAPQSYTVQRCVSTMRKLRVRHLPIIDRESEAVKAVISMQDICRQIACTLKQHDQLETSVTVGDMLDDPNVNTPGLDVALPATASVADATTMMREKSSGSMLVLGDEQFGIFTERDHVHSVVPYDERSLHDIQLREVARFTSGHSKRTMREIASTPRMDMAYRPSTITCVERKTRLADALHLMLGNGLLYVPVTEDSRPIDIISMRDINLFLAPSC